MTSEAPEAVRRRLALVLDVDDLVEAERLAIRMQPYFGVAKIGLELFSAAGPEAIGSIRELGYEVFLDLKLFASRAARCSAPSKAPTPPAWKLRFPSRSRCSPRMRALPLTSCLSA